MKLEVVMNRNGFTQKVVTFTEKDLPSTLATNYCNINATRIQWLPKEHLLANDIGKLSFDKKQRQKKSVQQLNITLSKLTRCQKVAEIFELTEKITPLAEAIKIDLNILVKRDLSEHDVISGNLSPSWVSHFEMMQGIGSLRFKRAIISKYALSLVINTIDAVDTGNKMTYVAIYPKVLIKRKWYILLSAGVFQIKSCF